METKCFFKVFLAILSDADLGFTFTIIAIVKARPSNQGKAMHYASINSIKDLKYLKM